MSYPIELRDHQLATGITFSGTGKKAVWGPARSSYIVRGFGIVPTTTKAKVTKPVFAVRLATAGQTATAVSNQATLTLISGATRGVAFYRKTTPFKVKQGQEVAVMVTTAATIAFKAKAVL